MNFDSVVFPGQASQCQYMGKDFVEAYIEAAEVFRVAQNAVGFDVYDVCQSADKINQTEYTQPCILTVEVAIYRALQQHFAFQPKFFAGHSLGEYTALVVANVIPLEIAVQVVHFRGKLMQYAAPAGSMAAIIMENIPYQEIQSVAHKSNVDIANDNSCKQIVISGETDQVKQVTALLEQQFAAKIRIVFLPVSAPFHSRHMQKIEYEFGNYLVGLRHTFDVKWLTKVISNYYGNFYHEVHIDLLIDGLIKQLSGTVKWRDNMNNLVRAASNIIEVGPSCPLRGFFKTMGVNIQAISSIKNLEKLVCLETTV